MLAESAARTRLGRPRRQEAEGVRVSTAVRESPAGPGKSIVFVVGILFFLLPVVLPVVGLAFLEPKVKLEQVKAGPAPFPQPGT